MHRQGAAGGDYQKRRETTWAALGYGCFAPGRVAMDEYRERVMAETARSRFLVPPESAEGRRSAGSAPFPMLGRLFVFFQGRFRQRSSCGATIATWRKSPVG